jgi:HSP20 family molecular chaperone IbpA
MTKEIEKRESRPDVWSDFDRVFHELSAGFFEPFGVAGYVPAVPSDGAGFRPARTDVSETGSAYRIVAEVPGIPKEKLDIRVRGSTVEIRGETTEEKETEGTSYVHRERVHQGYYRALELPEPVVAAEAKAKVDHGLLELELPKQHPTPEPTEVKVPVP